MKNAGESAEVGATLRGEKDNLGRLALLYHFLHKYLRQKYVDGELSQG